VCCSESCHALKPKYTGCVLCAVRGVWCEVCVAVCCGVLRCAAVSHVRYVLRCVAVCCGVLQWAMSHTQAWLHRPCVMCHVWCVPCVVCESCLRVYRYSVSSHGHSLCCNELQCVLQCVVVRCSALQYVTSHTQALLVMWHVLCVVCESCLGT